MNSKSISIESFNSDPISKIVIKNSIPALVAMMMVMVYNIADTFFLGLTHNDLQVTAVSFATPLFMIFMSLGTLFGVGGTSVISRALGEGKVDRAKKACSFCMWSCVAVGAFFMILLWIFLEDVTKMLGASGASLKLTEDYLRIVIGCGIFSMISNCFSSIVRTEGESMKAMTGTLIGNLLNLILDPIFILGFKWGVVGAAVATVIGNAVAAGYYIMYYLKGKSVLSISLKHFSMKDKILTGVLSVGISASIANLLSSVTSIFVNSQLSGYDGGDMLVAGYGVTAKIIMLVTLIGIGIGSGVQPFLGYCYGAKNKARFTAGFRFTFFFGIIFCLVISGLCFLFAGPIVKIFLTDFTAFGSGIHFTRILMTTGWLIGPFIICQNALQAMGAATPALLSTVIRQAVIFVPAVLIMKALIGVDGLIWAQPITDVLSLIIVLLMLRSKIRRIES
ncbi:MAG: MATE family efflux transporter [Lachnospiraceae bacterium]|nr:MATE family efflux transporter [Lachnospiraceae bacterium]